MEDDTKPCSYSEANCEAGGIGAKLEMPSVSSPASCWSTAGTVQADTYVQHVDTSEGSCQKQPAIFEDTRHLSFT